MITDKTRRPSTGSPGGALLLSMWKRCTAGNLLGRSVEREAVLSYPDVSFDRVFRDWFCMSILRLHRIFHVLSL